MACTPIQPLPRLTPLESADDNPCASRVQEQVAALFRAPRRLSGEIRIEWRLPLPPLAFSARDVMSASGVFSTTHLQGFVRTYLDALPVAFSHSADRYGALLVARRTPKGLAIADIHPLHLHHPSGVHAIGTRVAVADGDDLVLFDLARPSAERTLRIRGKLGWLRRGGGGIALAKLGARQHLLLVASPGSRVPGPRSTAFFRLQGGLEPGARLSFLGRDDYREPASFPPGEFHGFSENLTVLRECRTGDLFTLHSSGPSRLWGTGYYRLSRVEGLPDRPSLTPVALHELRQDQASCHLRSAATAFVTKDGSIELTCAEHALHMGLGLREHTTLRFTRFVAGTPAQKP